MKKLGGKDFFQKTKLAKRSESRKWHGNSGRILHVKGECGWTDTIRRKENEERYLTIPGF